MDSITASLEIIAHGFFGAIVVLIWVITKIVLEHRE